MNSNIFFQPFVGKDYANGGIFGKRIIIVMRVVRIVATASYIGSV